MGADGQWNRIGELKKWLKDLESELKDICPKNRKLQIELNAVLKKENELREKYNGIKSELKDVLYEYYVE